MVCKRKYHNVWSWHWKNTTTTLRGDKQPRIYILTQTHTYISTYIEKAQGPCCHDVITLSMIMLPLLKTHISSTTRALKMTVITLEAAAAIYHLKRWFELEPQSSKNPKRERRKKKKFINYITCDQPEHNTMVHRSKYYS